MVKFYIIFLFFLMPFFVSRPFERIDDGNKTTVDSTVVDSGDLYLIMFIEDAPYFNGDIREFIQRELHYPLSAQKDCVEGTVYISFMIDTMGVTNNHKVVKGIREDLNDEALRVTRKIKFDKPAFQRGKPIAVRFTVPVVFDLQQKK